MSGGVDSSVTAALATRTRRVGVIATQATVRSHAYFDAIKDENPVIEVYEHATPALVPMVDPGRVCPEGGALALGHPWGASGAILAVRLFSQLMRPAGGRYGLAAIAVGGGQGVAMVVESCR